MIENYRVIEVLFGLLLDNKQTSKSYSCLKTLCEQTLAQHGNVNNDMEYEGIERYQMKRIYDDEKGNKYDDTKADNKWLNEDNFKKYCRDFVNKHIEHFKEFNLIPIIETTQDAVGKGNKKLFWLETTSINIEEKHIENNLELTKIDYIRESAEQIKLAFFVKPFFKQGELKNRSIKAVGFFMIWYLLSIGIIGFLIVLAYIISLMGNAFITFQLLMFIAISVIGFAWIKYVLMPFLKLPECRVIKAPLLMLGWNEYHAEIEMHRDFKEQRTRFTRFTADCPICSGEIILSNGTKDHNLLLVGRCSESPLLHVYSFDRALLKGKLLTEQLMSL